MLKANDLVKYHVQADLLSNLGFRVGHMYEVTQEQLGLGLRIGSFFVVLIKNDGVATDWADHFTLHKCPVVLPRGTNETLG